MEQEAQESSDTITAPTGSSINQPGFEFSPEQIAWREQALEALEDLMTRLQPLEEKGVQFWAEQDYAELVSTVATGEQYYGEQKFREARDIYQRALTQVISLESQTQPIFNKLLARGEGLITKKEYDEAIQPLELARLIEPGNERVSRAINTATHGKAVDRLLLKASFAIDEGQPTDALPLLQEASSLDGTRQDIFETIEYAQMLSRRIAFQSSLQTGYSALEAQKYSEAINLFKKAIALEPRNSEAANALNLAETQKLEYDLESLERQAAAAMTAEDWTQAIRLYENALNLRQDEAFAVTGLQEATFLNVKKNQMLELLAKPERLADDAVGLHAASVLDELGTRDLPPKLSETFAKLHQSLAAYSSPVEVTLLSDSRSQVTLVRRESFSPFRQKMLQLKPGQYTLVARRSGYRDKRITFEVPVDGSPISIAIRVDEKL